MRIISLLLVLLVSKNTAAQNFEGEITYVNTYKNIGSGDINQQFTRMMGDTQWYYIKAGNYKSVANGSLFQWQLYINAHNKLYTKMANSATVFWNDGAVNTDSVINAVINKKAAVVLGYDCDELVLTCRSGVQKYYFNTGLAVDAALFKNHEYGNWYAFVSRSNALPLKSIVVTPQFVLESTAVGLQPIQVEDKIFTLAPGSSIIKSPY